MARRRRSLWGLLALPLLAGALLVMHGFGATPDTTTAAAAARAVDAPSASTGDTTCPTCEPHAMVMVCLAVLGGVVSAVIGARRWAGGALVPITIAGRGIRHASSSLPPLDPVWRRLSVMLR